MHNLLCPGLAEEEEKISLHNNLHSYMGLFIGLHNLIHNAVITWFSELLTMNGNLFA
jgi:hypothetical protein